MLIIFLLLITMEQLQTQFYQVLQARLNSNAVHVKEQILPKMASVSLTFVHPRGKIKRAHVPPASSIPINLKSLFKHEQFISVCNMVATCSWIPFPNLSYLAHYLPSVEYISTNTSAMTIRIDKIAYRLFTTGVVVTTSGKTVEQSKYEAHQFRLFMNCVKVPILLFDRSNPNHKPYFEYRTLEPLSEFVDFKVVNMVAAAVANKQPLDLMKIVSEAAVAVANRQSSPNAMDNGPIGEASWSPEHFPGARIKLYRSEALPFNTNSISTHLFDTGKNMIMGTNLEDMRLAQQFICKWVSPYIDLNLPMNPLNRHEYRLMRMLTYSRNKAPLLSTPNHDGTTPPVSAAHDHRAGEQFKNSILSLLGETSDIPASIPSYLGPSLGTAPQLNPNIDEELDDEQEEEVENFIETYLEDLLLSNIKSVNIIRRK